MSKTPNNHLRERTSTTLGMTLRTEEGDQLKSEFTQLVNQTDMPDASRKVLLASGSRILERHSSVYPDSAFLAEIEKLAPGSTKAIIDSCIKHQEDCHAFDMRELEVKEKEISVFDNMTKRDAGLMSQGRWIGFAAYIILLAFSIYMYSIGAHTIASLAFGASVFSVIGQLIRGQGSMLKFSSRKPPTDTKNGSKPK